MSAVGLSARWTDGSRAAEVVDAGACHPGHRRRGAGRLDHDGVQRLQPARRSSRPSCASGSSPRPTSSATPARTRSPRSLRRGRTGVLGVVLGEALAYAFEDPATVEFLRGLAGGRDRAASRPATGGAGDAALVLDAAVDAFVLYAVPDGHPLVDAVLRRRLPVVVQSGPHLEGHPFVAIDERRRGRERRPITCGRSGIRGWRCSRLPFSLSAPRATDPLRAEPPGPPRRPRTAREATASQ